MQKKFETNARRKTQRCRTFELKLNHRKFSKNDKEYFNKLFLDAKKMYNYLVTSDDLFEFDTKANSVPSFNKDKEIYTYDFKNISSQMKQSLKTKTISSIKSLSTNKKKGIKVGKLKPKKAVNSIPLKQFNSTYYIDFQRNRIKIQGNKKWFRVFGLTQIKKLQELYNVEISSATLDREDDFIFLRVACWTNEEKIVPTDTCAVGIDFGIKDSMCFSNGIKLDTKIKLPNYIRKAHRKLSKAVKDSKNYKKRRTQLRKAYSHYGNAKSDIRNKVVSFLRNNFQIIAIQDENIKGWHQKWFGKQIQQSSIGKLVSGIKSLPETIVIDRYVPTTKCCYECGTINDIPLEERTYRCSCGYVNDRDTKSAIFMLKYTIPDDVFKSSERRLLELSTSSIMMEYFKTIPYVKVSI